jgi:flagellar protein FliO/FliZ
MDIADYLRFIFAFGFVLGLIALCAYGVRRFGLVPGAAGIGRAEKRMRIVESLSLDPRRRLVLVRRDGVEHLILLGASGETVVERRMVPPAAATKAAEAEAETVDTGAEVAAATGTASGTDLVPAEDRQSAQALDALPPALRPFSARLGRFLAERGGRSAGGAGR